MCFHSLLFCYFIEVSQLYQAGWINNLRNTTIGGLILGHGFLWSDILAYSFGVTIATIIELLKCKLASFKKNKEWKDNDVLYPDDYDKSYREHQTVQEMLESLQNY